MGRRRSYAAFESVGGVRAAKDELHRLHGRPDQVALATKPERGDLLEVV